jgi:hypothetical protein
MWTAILVVQSLTVAACAGGQQSLTQVEQQLKGGGDTSAGGDQASEGEGSDQETEGEEAVNDGMGPVPDRLPEGTRSRQAGGGTQLQLQPESRDGRVLGERDH